MGKELQPIVVITRADIVLLGHNFQFSWKMILGTKITRRLKAWLPALCVVYVYVFTFMFALPVRMTDKVYSSFFRYNKSDVSLIRRATEKNADRLSSAKVYLDGRVMNVKDMNTNRIVPAVSSGITVGIITIQRSVERTKGFDLGYLTQVVAAYHKLSKEDTLFETKNVFICNVDPAGELYKEASQYSSIVDVAVKYRTASTNQSTFKNWDKFDKEKSDYQFCLNQSTSYGTPLVLIVEDDAIPRDDFFSVLSRALTQKGLIAGDLARMGHSMEGVGFIKLYYPEKWAGYGSELTHVLELTAAALVGGTVFLVTSIVWLSLERARRKTGQTYVFAFICGALYAFLLIRTIGRPYVLEYLAQTFAYYRLTPARGCCTQAVVYPRQSAARIVIYLGGVKCRQSYSVDIAIDTFAANNNLRAWLVEPNLVHHIGMYSTLRQDSKQAAEFI